MSIISRILNKISLWLAYPYFRVRSWWPVWLHMVNHAERRAFDVASGTLSPVQQRIVSDLNRDGIAVAHIDELLPGSDMFARLQEYTAQRKKDAETKTHKSFLKNLWDAVPTIDFQNPFVPLALDYAVLGTVNEYMQMFSYFFYLTLNVTTPVSEGSEAVQSQRWHGDPEDKKMCKVFMYLNDVDEGSGPFVYVSGTQYGGRWHHLFRKQPPRGFLLKEGSIDELVPADDIKYYTGRAGTIIFCDTSGYHRGGYATEHERIMLTMGYCSGASAYPLRVRFDDSFMREAKKQGLSSAALHALRFSRSAVTQHFFRVIKPNFKYGAD